MNPSIALIVAIVGGLVWLIATREWKAKDATVADMGRWAYILGLAAVLYFGGK